MKLYNICLFFIAILLPFTGTCQVKKYDIKSGIITFEQTITAGKMTIKDQIVVTFDDYGFKECRDTYSGKTLDESYMSDGKTIYKIKPNQKTAYAMGKAFRGTELKSDWNEVSEKDKKEGKAKMMPAMTVAGKKCEAFQTISGTTTSTFAGFKGVTLFSEVKMGQSTTTTRAIKFEESVKIPALKFQVPGGYTVKQFAP